MEGNKHVIYKSISTEKSKIQKYLQKSLSYRLFSPAIWFPRHTLKFLIDKDASTAPKYCDHGFSKTDTDQEQ